MERCEVPGRAVKSVQPRRSRYESATLLVRSGGVVKFVQSRRFRYRSATLVVRSGGVVKLVQPISFNVLSAVLLVRSGDVINFEQPLKSSPLRRTVWVRSDGVVKRVQPLSLSSLSATLLVRPGFAQMQRPPGPGGNNNPPLFAPLYLNFTTSTSLNFTSLLTRRGAHFDPPWATQIALKSTSSRLLTSFLFEHVIFQNLAPARGRA